MNTDSFRKRSQFTVLPLFYFTCCAAIFGAHKKAANLIGAQNNRDFGSRRKTPTSVEASIINDVMAVRRDIRDDVTAYVKFNY